MLSVGLVEITFTFYSEGNFNEWNRLVSQPSIYYKCITMCDNMDAMDVMFSRTLDPYPACTTKVLHGCAKIANLRSTV